MDGSGPNSAAPRRHFALATYLVIWNLCNYTLTPRDSFTLKPGKKLKSLIPRFKPVNT